MVRERTASDAARLLDQLAESSADIIWMFTRDWDELVFVNSAYEGIWGRSVEALEADSGDFLRGIHRGDRDRVRAAMERLSAGEFVELEYRVNESEEFGRWVWVQGRPVYDPDGDIVGVAGFARDVTDRKRREDELRRQNDRLDEFARVVSHDLRNPLSVASGRLTLAAEACETEHIGAAAEALERMADIVDATLTLARQGRTVTDPERVAVADLVEGCWRMVQTGDARLSVADEFDVDGDPSQLRHLFENLFRNAVEHGSTGSQRAERADDSVEHGSTGSRSQADHAVTDAAPDRAGPTVRVGPLEDGFYVEDDGPGIPAGEQEAVFDAGYTTDREGSGL